MRNVAVSVLTLAVTCAGCAMFPSHSAGIQGIVPSVAAPLDFGARKHIKHIVIIIQENRSFESLFAGYPSADAPMYGCGAPKTSPLPGDDEVSPNIVCPSGDRLIKLHQVTFQKEPDLSHEFESGIIDWRNGKMDGFTYWGRWQGPHPNTAAYAYVERSQVAPYWTMAHQYVLADKMFPTEFGPSWTAHLTLVAGTDNLNDKLALADFADGEDNCVAPVGTKSTTVDAKRAVHRAAGPYPCFDQFNTMAQVLDTAGVSWKYYVAKKLKAFIWSPFSGIKYVYQGRDWGANIVVPQTQILQDAAQGKLAAISWVTPSKQDSDHPGARSDTGPSWVASVVNAIGESQYWSSSAIIVLWDDWGGFYDNAPPPQLDFRGLGIRVPCLIISPYAKKGVVVHARYEFGSVLRFAREVFGLPPLGPTSKGYTDSRANGLSESFDFNKRPRQFKPIPSKYPMGRFLREPPSDEPIDEE